ncbi:SDR family oxidoreductase [Myxococcota bacterium]|nr:SDR family oxidoreductase [Myxococcota bacterium]
MTTRVALVTGGTRGLGKALSLRLARDGMTVAMAYRSAEAEAAEALAEVRALTPRAQIYACDIGAPDAVEELVARISAELGPVEVLVNNAFRGGKPPVKTHEVPVADFLENIGNNLVGHFLVTRACLPGMIARKFGRVVFIGSLAMRGERGRVAYSVAKNGLVGLAKTVAQEYARDGITANVVNPGYLEAGAFLRLTDEIRARAVSSVPSKRAGRPEEVAGLVSYLCSDEGAYTTGQVIGVDGGAP